MVEAKDKAKAEAAAKAREVKPFRDRTPRNRIDVHQAGEGHWVATIGPRSPRQPTASGPSPCSAIGYLLRGISGGQYEFDPDWRP